MRQAIVLAIICAGCRAQPVTPEGVESAAAPRCDEADGPDRPVDPSAVTHPELLPEWLEKTPDEQRRLMLGIQLTLAQLGYMLRPFTGELDGRTVAALKSFRRGSGLGDGYPIDNAVLARLQEDKRTINPPEIPILRPMSVRDFEDFVMIEGSWKRLEGNEPIPLRTSDIRCEAPRLATELSGGCVEATATHFSRVLGAEADFFVIRKWNEKEVVAERAEECTRTVLELNRLTRGVTKTVAVTSKEGICSGDARQDVTYRLVDGDELTDPAKQAPEPTLRALGLPDDLLKDSEEQRREE